MGKKDIVVKGAHKPDPPKRKFIVEIPKDLPPPEDVNIWWRPEYRNDPTNPLNQPGNEREKRRADEWLRRWENLEKEEKEARKKQAEHKREKNKKKRKENAEEKKRAFLEALKNRDIARDLFNKKGPEKMTEKDKIFYKEWGPAAFNKKYPNYEKEQERKAQKSAKKSGKNNNKFLAVIDPFTFQIDLNLPVMN